jgi:hypothetical protein
LCHTASLSVASRAPALCRAAAHRVLETLVQGLKGRWDAAAHACLHDVAALLEATSERLVDRHFGQFANARAYVKWVLAGFVLS